jgi:hypothetical protein
MVGLIVVVGWVIVGLVVAAVEKTVRRSPNTDDTMVTVLCVAGAIAGGFVGQTFRWYVFGEPLGFVFSAAGAELLLFFYRSRNAARQPGGEITGPVPAAQPRPPSPVTSDTSLGMRILQAFALGVVCGIASAICGSFGLLIGDRLFPQRYQQIPRALLFVPLGLIVGFIAAGTVRLARPRWSMARMFAVVALLAFAYGGLMFEDSRSNAQSAEITVALEPDQVRAASCGGTCPEADPPLRWTIQGHVRVHDKFGVGGTVSAIEITSVTYTTGPQAPHPYTKEGSAEAIRWRGPETRLTGGQIVGARHVGANETASYPIQYSYHTRDGASRRTVTVNVLFRNAAGQETFGMANWNVP